MSKMGKKKRLGAMSHLSPIALDLAHASPEVTIKVPVSCAVFGVWVGFLNCSIKGRGFPCQGANCFAGDDGLHGSTRYGSSSWLRALSRFSLELWHCLSRYRCVNTVSNSRWKNVGPFVYCLVRDANCTGGSRGRPTQQFDGFGFEHAPLNHSSNDFVNFGSKFHRYDLNYG
jgi:hypothetical protein